MTGLALQACPAEQSLLPVQLPARYQLAAAIICTTNGSWQIGTHLGRRFSTYMFGRIYRRCQLRVTRTQRESKMTYHFQEIEKRIGQR